MNFQPAIIQTIKATAAAYAAGKLTVEQIRDRQKRLANLRKRSGELERFKETKREQVAKIERGRARLKAAIAERGRIIAMDTGYKGEDDPIEELGITVWENGVMQTVTYVIPEAEDSRTIPSLFGPTLVVTRGEMLQIAQEAYDSAALVVFHTAHADLAKLDLDTTSCFYADVAKLDQIWSRTGLSNSLDAICRRYGIDNSCWHNSGNDSRRTLEVALAIIEDTTPPLWRF